MTARLPDQITGVLAREIAARKEWDEPPCLYFLYVEGGTPRLSPLGLPTEVWETDRPPQVIMGMAVAAGNLAAVLRQAVPPGLYGMAFRHEAWTVAAIPGTAEAAGVERAARQHRLHEHPARIEVRGIWAVDRAGITYMAEQRRGEPAVRRDVSYPEPGQGYSGTIPEALDLLVTAFLGVTPPARPRTPELG